MSYSKIEDLLIEIYGTEIGGSYLGRVIEVIQDNTLENHSGPDIDQSTVIVITYGDHINLRGEDPLKTLNKFMIREFSNLISHIHILPFYPYSSDDGFSVIDYLDVNPKLGNWSDIKNLGENYGLMFDLVINHVSVESMWFKQFLTGDKVFKDFFITVDPSLDLTSIRRPRTSPLLTPFEADSGQKHVWTTFSADQVDLNFANPEVLLAMTNILLKYIAMGAQIIRLDAITYLWKEVGTDGVHHVNTHLVVKFLRSIIEIVAPHILLITETNVPHSENISYFDDGKSEAHGVYNFALPPLLLHTIQTGNKDSFDKWAKQLQTPSDKTFFFNFTSSHDGIGLTPIKGILPQADIDLLVFRAEMNGAKINYKATENGEEEPYEINTSYYDALAVPEGSPEVSDSRFILSQAIMLSLKGVPGIYIGSLIGNKNWHEGVSTLGYNRAINRQKLTIGRDITYEEIENPATQRGGLIQKYRTLLQTRTTEPAFSPESHMEILHHHPALISISRGSDSSKVLALHNITDSTVNIKLEGEWVDNLSGVVFYDSISIKPYQVLWLKRQ